MWRRRWVVLLATLLMSAGCASKQAPEQAEPTETKTDEEGAEPEADEVSEASDKGDEAETFESSDGLYSAPVPRNWTVEEKGDYAVFESPEGDIQAYTLTIDSADLPMAIGEAWKTVAPEVEPEIERSFDPPPPEGVEKLHAIHYKPINGNVIAQAIGKLHDGTAYVVLFKGELAGVQKRGSQLNILFSGHEILAVDQTNIVEATPELTQEDMAKLDEHIQKTMDLYDIPGASVGVVYGGGVLWAKGYGVRIKGGGR